MVEINKEKEDIINEKGNLLITANPGTGKTLLLAHKYVNLLEQGLETSDILCLTFTTKARKEMEDRVLEIAHEKGKDVSPSDLHIYTFHSYAKKNIVEDSIISSNMLRYVIYDYLKENEVLSYGKKYIIQTIVPKLENLLRYIKTYGILPGDIDIAKTKEFLESTNTLSKEEMDSFAEELLKIYHKYEEVKEGRGLDYSDLLLQYLNLPKTERYEYVLIDELQDVNELEAEIALVSAKNFVAVGDKKQAIFGFQGGSIENFKKFKDSKKFILSENFRSTDQVLGYARKQFEQNTSEEEYERELKNLHSAESKTGPKPVIQEYNEQENYWDAVSTLTEKLTGEDKEIAIITRTNYQINEIARELKNRGIEFNITRNSASEIARENIITYIKGLLSNRVEDLQQALFTPFSPVELRKAFEITQEDNLEIKDIERKAPVIRKIREEIKNVEDINRLFEEKIIPISVSHGEDYLLAASTLQRAYQEYLQTVENKTLESLEVYLASTDLLVNDFSSEGGEVVITTVHKAKGREFDTVIYVPTDTRGNTGFWDEIGKAILKTKGIDAEEELEEESSRIHFVGITRAKENLHIVTNDEKQFKNEFSDANQLEVSKTNIENTQERMKRAFNLFINGEYEKARQLLNSKENWLHEIIGNHFKNLDHISFSSATDDPIEYLKNKILKLRTQTVSLAIGSRVHRIAERMVNGEEIEVDEDLKKYKENIKDLIKKIRESYPEFIGAEEEIRIELSKILEDVNEDIIFNGYIDAVFKNKNDEYLIVDWKTSRRKSYSTEHRRQLGIYKKAYAVKQNIPLDKIRTAIGYVSLQNRVNICEPWCELLEKQPSKQLMNTLRTRIEKVLEWKHDPEIFFQDLEEKKREGGPLINSILEQYQREINNN